MPELESPKWSLKLAAALEKIDTDPRTHEDRRRLGMMYILLLSEGEKVCLERWGVGTFHYATRALASVGLDWKEKLG
jgi:hypothetical protein